MSYDTAGNPIMVPPSGRCSVCGAILGTGGHSCGGAAPLSNLPPPPAIAVAIRCLTCNTVRDNPAVVCPLCEARTEVQRLTALLAKQEEAGRAAYEAGARQMRERAATYCEDEAYRIENGHTFAADIRGLPLSPGEPTI